MGGWVSVAKRRLAGVKMGGFGRREAPPHVVKDRLVGLRRETPLVKGRYFLSYSKKTTKYLKLETAQNIKMTSLNDGRMKRAEILGWMSDPSPKAPAKNNHCRWWYSVDPRSDFRIPK